METQENKIMGYSGFIIFEECYEYNENACFIANTQESAKEFMDNCGHSVFDYRIDQVTFGDIMNDFGCSSGEYAMESVVFSKFKKMANEENVKYESVEFEYDPTLTVVNIIEKYVLKTIIHIQYKNLGSSCAILLLHIVR